MSNNFRCVFDVIVFWPFSLALGLMHSYRSFGCFDFPGIARQNVESPEEQTWASTSAMTTND